MTAILCGPATELLYAMRAICRRQRHAYCRPPDLRRLAAELGLSQAKLRAALRQLLADGQLHAERRRGRVTRYYLRRL